MRLTSQLHSKLLFRCARRYDHAALKSNADAYYFDNPVPWRLNAYIGMWGGTSACGQRGLANMRESRRLIDSSFYLLPGPNWGLAVMRNSGKGMSSNWRSDSARGKRFTVEADLAFIIYNLQPQPIGDNFAQILLIYGTACLFTSLCLGPSRTHANHTCFN